MANEGAEKPNRVSAGSEGSGSPPPNGDGRIPPESGAPVSMKPAGYFEGESMTRRRMFTGGAVVAGQIAGVAVILPAIGFALGPVFEQKEAKWQDVGAPGDFHDDGYLPRTITISDNVADAGLSTVYIRRGNPTAFPREKKDEFIAISTRCAHAGCPVRWVNAAQRFVCPCHGGVYDFEGKVAGGPPVRPLDRFETRIRSGQVQIGPRFSVNSQLEKFSPRDPGEPLDGLWQYLYPKRFSTPDIN
jgi:Rieske Fe-S protein